MASKPLNPCQHPWCCKLTTGDFCSEHLKANLPQVVVVAGPPASGKTTYVRNHMEPGDLVVDLDPIKQSISYTDWYAAPDTVLPFALAAREAILRRLEEPSDVKRAWLIGMYPTLAQRRELRERFNAKVVVLEVPESTCLARIERAEERRNRPTAMWEELIKRWWVDYRPGPSDEVIRP